MKSYTDLEQSKKLAEMLPLESADMRYEKVCFDRPPEKCWYVKLHPPFKSDDIIPCWSLSALMELFDDKAGIAKEYGTWFAYDNGKSHCGKHCDSPLDAAFEMVAWLKENGKL